MNKKIHSPPFLSVCCLLLLPLATGFSLFAPFPVRLSQMYVHITCVPGKFGTRNFVVSPQPYVLLLDIHTGKTAAAHTQRETKQQASLPTKIRITADSFSSVVSDSAYAIYTFIKLEATLRMKAYIFFVLFGCCLPCRYYKR